MATGGLGLDVDEDVVTLGVRGPVVHAAGTWSWSWSTLRSPAWRASS